MLCGVSNQLLMNLAFVSLWIKFFRGQRVSYIAAYISIEAVYTVLHINNYFQLFINVSKSQLS